MKYIMFALLVLSGPISAEYVCPPCSSQKTSVTSLEIIEGLVTGTGMRANGTHYVLVQGVSRNFADDVIAAGLEYGDYVTLACTRICWLWGIKKKTL